MEKDEMSYFRLFLTPYHACQYKVSTNSMVPSADRGVGNTAVRDGPSGGSHGQLFILKRLPHPLVLQELGSIQ